MMHCWPQAKPEQLYSTIVHSQAKPEQRVSAKMLYSERMVRKLEGLTSIYPIVDIQLLPQSTPIPYGYATIEPCMCLITCAVKICGHHGARHRQALLSVGFHSH